MDRAERSPSLSHPDTAVRTLVLTDLVGSTHLTARLGDRRAADISSLHDRRARELLESYAGLEIDKTDGFLLLFELPEVAVQYALAYHRLLAELSAEVEVELKARVGIHEAEVILRWNSREEVARGAKPLEVEGLAKPTAARVMALAQAGQTLVTRTAFDAARRSSLGADESEELEWLAHGAYLMKGLDEEIDIFEVGVPGLSPLTLPTDGDKASRSLLSEQEEQTLGWRPAAGLAVPGRSEWLLEAQVGEGGFGEVWIAQRGDDEPRESEAKRVFKFCFKAERIRALRREVVLFRLLQETLGHRDDIAQILGWQFEAPPYFLESEYSAGGDVGQWAEARGGLPEIPLPERIDIVAQTAGALGAAHSVGVLHKDIKPSNILIHPNGERVKVRLADFGIGLVTDEATLSSKGVMGAGLTETLLSSSGAAGGTPLYMAPEVFAGDIATTRSDLYSLGVVLYQAILGDFSKPVAAGWEREVEEELLREDIAACVDGDPERRVASAGELARRLRGLAERRAERDARRRLEEEAARGRRRRRQFAIASAIGLTLTLVAGAFAWRERARATEESRLKQEALTAEELARQREYDAKSLLVQVSWEQRNLPRFVELLETQRPRPGQQDLRGFEWFYWWNTYQRGYTSLDELDHPVRSVAYSADGRLLVAGGGTITGAGEVRVWNLAERSLLAHEEFPNRVHGVAISPDGKLLAAARGDAGEGTGVTVWELGTGRRVLVRELETSPSAVAFSPDGRRLAVGSGSFGDPEGVSVWELETGRQILMTNQSTVWSVAWSPDGRRFAAGTGSGQPLEGAVEVWDVEQGQQVLALTPEADFGFEVAYSPDGSRLAAAVGPWSGAPGIIKIWDATSGQELPVRLQGHEGRVVGVAWSPDGARLASSSFDKTVRVWESASGKELLTLRGHEGSVNSVAWSPDGTSLASGGEAQSVKLWDARSGQNALTFAGHTGELTDVAFQPKGQLVASSDQGEPGKVRVWSRINGETLWSVEAESGYVASVAWSPDGTLLALGCGDWVDYDRPGLGTGRVEVWDVATRSPVLALAGLFSAPTHVTFSPDGRHVSASNGGWLDSGEVKTWDLESGHQIPLPKEASTGTWSGVAYSPDGRYFAWGRAPSIQPVGQPLDIAAARAQGPQEEVVYVWDLESDRLAWTLASHTAPVLAVAFSRDSRRLATGSQDKTIKIWDMTSGQELLTLSGHSGRVHDVTFGPDDKRLVSGGQDSMVRLWNVATGQEILTLDEHQSYTWNVAFSDDGHHIASASADGTVKIWDGTPPEEAESLPAD